MTSQMTESELLAQKLVDHVSCVTQLDPEKGELANVDDWRRNAEKLFREELKKVRDAAFRAGFNRGLLELPPDLRRP